MLVIVLYEETINTYFAIIVTIESTLLVISTNIETRFIRDPQDRKLPWSVFEVQRRTNHRPRTSYRVVLHNIDDVSMARKLGIPVFALKDTLVTMLGYPMNFPPIVLIPRTLSTAVFTKLPVIEFLSESAAGDPRLEDIVVAMLKFDSIAARTLAQRTLDMINREYLLKRIYQEDLEEIASRVRFQDLPLSLPVKGEQLPKSALDRVIAANQPKGVIP